MIEIKAEHNEIINDVIDRAREIASEKSEIVWFDFNGRIIKVSGWSDSASLLIEYNWSFIMDWEEVNGNQIHIADNIIKYGNLKKLLDELEKEQASAETALRLEFTIKRNKILGK